MKPVHLQQRKPARTRDRARSNLLVGAAVLTFACYGIAQNLPQATESPPVPNTVTEEQAKVIALQRVPGKVTEVAIENKRGKPVYVVEIRTEKNGEKDVFIDMKSGAVVGTD